MVGNQTRVKVVKNKVAPPFKQIEFDIMYGEGISKTGELVDLGVKAGIVEKSGAWFSFDSERIGQGRENAKAYLKEHPDMAAKIERAIRQKRGPDRRQDPRRRGRATMPPTAARAAALPRARRRDAASRAGRRGAAAAAPESRALEARLAHAAACWTGRVAHLMSGAGPEPFPSLGRGPSGAWRLRRIG